MNGIAVFGWCCVAAGLWGVIRAFRARTRRITLLRNCVSVKGKVIRLDDSTTEGDVTSTCTPVVKYQAQDGKSYEITLLPRQDTTKSRVGSTVKILYNKDDPQHAVDSERVWDVNLICVLSLFPVLIGSGIIFTDYQEKLERKVSPQSHATPAP